MPRDPSDNEMWNMITKDFNYTIDEGGGGDDLSVELLTPKQIVAELDKSVIGQTKAKQLMAIAVWNRLLSHNNITIGRNEDEYYFEKNNILLVGNTGCGKTHLIKTLSKVVSLPVTIQDGTSFTSAGYVGRDVGECVTELVSSAIALVAKNYDTNAMTSSTRKKLIKSVAEHGIIYIDEADKLRATTAGKDVNGRCVQEAFLRIVEGSPIKVRLLEYCGKIDTSNILFVFGGAFLGLDKIVAHRLGTNGMGFSAPVATLEEKTNMLQEASVADFTRYGMIPELMGRLSTVAVLKELDKDTVYRIFTEPDRSIMSQAINEFKSYGVEASFTREAVEFIVDEAAKLKLGARGLKSVCQQMLRPLYYHLPSNLLDHPLIITKEMLLGLDIEDVDDE